jgi:hypothetical protein
LLIFSIGGMHAHPGMYACMLVERRRHPARPSLAAKGCFRKIKNSENIHRYGKALQVRYLQNNPPEVAAKMVVSAMPTQQISPYAPPQTGFPGPGNAVRLHANNQDRFGS